MLVSKHPCSSLDPASNIILLLGHGLDLELLDWLERVSQLGPSEIADPLTLFSAQDHLPDRSPCLSFTMQCRIFASAETSTIYQFASIPYAQRIYTKVVDTLIATGTTTAVYFATLHLPATKLLASICHAKGQRAFVGKSCMDRNGASDGSYVEPSARSSLSETKELIDFVRGLDQGQDGEANGLVKPMLAPRFAISCTDELLTGLGAIGKADPGLNIQTHCMPPFPSFARARM
jgi:Amidohydrolase family